MTETKLENKMWRLSHLYKIRTKDAKLKVFVPKPAQLNYLENETKRDQILKARQLGFTTLKLVEQLDEVITTPNMVAALIAHRKDKVQSIFNIVKLAYKYLPQEIKPRASFDNKNELTFPDLDSKIFVALDTRSETVHNLHISELAFVRNPEEILAAALESVPPWGKISIESTANGNSGAFYDDWYNPKSEFKKHFYNWMSDPEYYIEPIESWEIMREEYKFLAKEYELIEDAPERFKMTPGRLAFYLTKIRRHKRKVREEYPLTPDEAFISVGRNVFRDSTLQKHFDKPPIDRKWGSLLLWEKPMNNFKYVIGCDPAEGTGNDNSVIEVYNAYTGEQAAEFADNQIKPRDLSNYLMEVGKYFNNGLIVLEMNSHGMSVLDGIRGKYSNIYRREIFDKHSREYKKELGWRTTGTSKPLLVSNLNEYLDNEDIKVYSKYTKSELKVFVRTDEQGKQGYGAEGSNKDDRVIATGLCVQGIKQMPAMKREKPLAQKKFEEFIKIQEIIKNINLPNQSISVSEMRKKLKNRNYSIRGSNFN
jgi:hypothetical protein